ncbi:hypothetical protein U9M48_037052 [Paspalum notatum var. saurae]|uniref:Uncharacterized protein n=1 Tax=Paspalum notatum var. saurae TaxID=547442 RepID=A0AAQ3UIC3_PASNO
MELAGAALPSAAPMDARGRGRRAHQVLRRSPGPRHRGGRRWRTRGCGEGPGQALRLGLGLSRQGEGPLVTTMVSNGAGAEHHTQLVVTIDSLLL